MGDRKTWWPYILAVLSAFLAPSALQHAWEPLQSARVVDAVEAPAPGPAAANQTKDPADAKAWQEFLCSYYYARNESGSFCKSPPSAQFLIAGVPDPEATSVPGTFDVMVEAMVGAAAAEDWRYDRNWLPWGPGKQDAKTGDSPANPAVANERPGLLLFRKGEQLLVIFLVGETPTSGVNKTALVNASRFVLNRGGALKILGPRFSGSTPSYKLALDELAKAQPPGWKAHFVTGSATAESNARSLEPHVYEATVEHDGRTTALFLRWLATRGIESNHVAMLSEAGTAFGAELYKSGNNILRVEFPYQISRLRNAYEKDPELKAIWKDPASSKQDGKLDWSLTTEREDTDRVRTFQGPQTTLLQERQLEQITDQLRRRKIRAAGINATDVLDTVFLTLLVRRACPDVRVFTLDSDLLFTYSSGPLTFNGMLMVSPYSLWSEIPRPLLRNPNRSAVGVHNAFIRLMDGSSYRDYWSPTGDDRPALWISAIGRGRVWPLDVLTGNGASQLARAGSVKAFAPWLPDPDWTYWGLWCATGLMVSYGLIVFLTRRVAERGWLGPTFDPAFFFLLEPPDRSLERTLLLQMLCAFGLVALLPFSVRGGWWLILPPLLVFLVTTLQEPRRTAAVLMGLGFALPLLFGCFFWSQHAAGADGEPWERFFFDYRLVHPASGVSPLPSWLFAWFGCAWWAVMRINQLRNWEVRSPRLSSWPAGEPLLAALAKVAPQADALSGPLGFARGFFFAVCVSFSLLWWTLPEGIWGLERESGYGSWASGVFLAIILLTVFLLVSLVQLYNTQRVAMDILHALRDHPLGDAFSGLPKDLAASELWQRGNNRHPFQSCVHSVRRLRQIPEAAAHLPEAERLLAQLLERSAAGLRAHGDDAGKLHESLNSAAFSLYPALSEKWRQRTAEEKPGVADEFVALRLGALLRYLVIQMRAAIEFLSLGLVLLMLAAIAYPFEPQQGLIYMVAAVLGAAGIVILYSVTRINGHLVMRKFASQAGAPSFLDGFRKLAMVSLPPTLAALTALFPGSVRSLAGLLEAATKYLGAK